MERATGGRYGDGGVATARRRVENDDDGERAIASSRRDAVITNEMTARIIIVELF